LGRLRGRRGPQRDVQGVAADRAVLGDGGFVADQAQQQRPPRRLAGRVQGLVEGDRSLGEGAGLVGEQHLDVAEIFDGDQPFDQHPAAGQLARPGRQADADDRRQQLRGDADRDRQGEQQRLKQRTGQGDVDDKDRGRQHRGDPYQQLGEAPQPRLERGLGLALAEPDGDLAERGQRAGGHHDPAPRALVDHGTHERARGQVDGGVTSGDRVGRLDRRDGLAGQDGLVALQLVGLQQPQVGRDHIAHAQGHHVARHQVTHVQALLAAVAPDQGLVADACVQRGDRHLGAVLVDEAQPHAQDDDRGDDGPVGGVAGGGGDARGGQQQDQQRVAELAAQDPKGGHPVGGQHVAADTSQPAGGLVGGEAGLGAAQLLEHHTHRLTRGGCKVERRPLWPCRRHRRGDLTHSLLLVTRRRQRSSRPPALPTEACHTMYSDSAARGSSTSTASTIATASAPPDAVTTSNHTSTTSSVAVTIAPAWTHQACRQAAHPVAASAANSPASNPAQATSQLLDALREGSDQATYTIHGNRQTASSRYSGPTQRGASRAGARSPGALRRPGGAGTPGLGSSGATATSPARLFNPTANRPRPTRRRSTSMPHDIVQRLRPRRVEASIMRRAIHGRLLRRRR
jgi:hypothetical protein